MRRNIKAEKRKQQRIAYKEARDNNTRLPHGGRVKRSHHIHGEVAYRKIVCRYYNRRDRRMANMQAKEARFDHDLIISGRPFVNMISSTNRITS